MDILKFIENASPTLLDEARVVNGEATVMWVERYRKHGEFKITAPLSSGLIQDLPLNALVGLEASYDVMMVENHLITEKMGEDPKIEISGRTLSAFLGHRIVGMEQDISSPNAPLEEIALAEADTWDQVVTLINTHIDTATVANAADGLSGIVAVADNPGTLTGLTATSERRVLRRGPVDDRVLEILAVDDLGLRVVRRNPFGELGDTDDTWFLVHAGNNKTGTVIFSWAAGDLDEAEYLWSTKTDKDSALVTGKHFEFNEDSAKTGYDRRATLVDAGDIDGIFTSDPPTGGDKTAVVASMTTRGKEELSSRQPYVLTRADISSNAAFSWRRDYDIGDIVSVDGSYGDIVPMRVTEYTQILDEGGESGHPTLEALYT